MPVWLVSNGIALRGSNAADAGGCCGVDQADRGGGDTNRPLSADCP